MPQRKVARVPKSSSPKAHQVVSAEEKIARLLGILVVKDIEQKTDQVALLRSVGFEVSEVAAMLGLTENWVNVAAYRGRKRGVSLNGKRGSRSVPYAEH